MEAMLWAFLQTVSHHALQRWRNLAAGLSRLRRLCIQNRVHRLDRRIALERSLARQHLVENGAEGEDVRAMIGLLPAHLLRRHIADSAQHHARIGKLLLRRRFSVNYTANVWRLQLC